MSRIPVYGRARAQVIPSQFAIIVQNLLLNASKFTAALSAPEINVFIETRTFQDLKNRYPDPFGGYIARGEWIEIIVEDNGPGIKEDFCKETFSSFILPQTKRSPGRS